MPAAITKAPASAAPHLIRVGTVTIPAQPGAPDRETVGDAPAVLPLPVPPPVDSATGPATLFRVERGVATAEEVAAVAAVLLARAAAVRAAAETARLINSRQAGARWRAHDFAGPRAWTSGVQGLLAS